MDHMFGTPIFHLRLQAHRQLGISLRCGLRHFSFSWFGDPMPEILFPKRFFQNHHPSTGLREGDLGSDPSYSKMYGKETRIGPRVTKKVLGIWQKVIGRVTRIFPNVSGKVTYRTVGTLGPRACWFMAF